MLGGIHVGEYVNLPMGTLPGKASFEQLLSQRRRRSQDIRRQPIGALESVGRIIGCERR